MPLGGALTTGSAILGAAKGIGNFISGHNDEKKANEELSRLQKPFYKIQNEYQQNTNLAGSMAGQGLPSAAKDYLTTESQRGLGATIDNISASGGSPSDVARAYEIYTRSIDRNAAEDATAQQQNIQNFMKQNTDLAAQKNIQFGINENQPYQNKLKEITERISAAKQNQNNGLNTAIGSVGAAGTGLTNQDLLNNLFKSQATAPQSSLQPSQRLTYNPQPATVAPAQGAGIGNITPYNAVNATDSMGFPDYSFE